MPHHDHDDHDGDHSHEHGHHHHGHHHGHHHSHTPKNFDRAFAIGVSLNLALVIGQVVFGLMAHSLALVADAGHNFADVIGLVLAWWASRLCKSLPTRKHTYGLRSASILAALANAILLLATMGAVAWEAITRLQTPPIVNGKIVMWLALAGIIVNGASALLFFSGRKGDLNIRGAFLHLAADAGISVGVLLTGFAIFYTQKLWLDPVVSLIIVGIILYGTWGLLKDSLNLSLQAVPENIDRDAVETFLRSLPNVQEIHDLHIWGMSTSEVALTAHLVMKPATVDDSLLARASEHLREKFQICHATMQIESGDPKHPCQLSPVDSV